MKEQGRRIHSAKFLADISKVVIGGGIVARIFSADIIDWVEFAIAFGAGLTLFLVSLVIYPKEERWN